MRPIAFNQLSNLSNEHYNRANQFDFYLKSTRRPICKKLEKFIIPSKKLIAHFMLSTHAKVTQKDMGPIRVLRKAPMEKQVIRTWAALDVRTCISEVT